MKMNEDLKPISKVLVLDGDAVSLERIRAFCEAHGLQGLRVGRHGLLSVLNTNLDLGGVLIAERLGDEPQSGLALARQVHALRPELPIFLRRDGLAGPAAAPALTPQDDSMLAAAYTLETIESLGAVVDQHIFSVVYPEAVVRGIVDITLASMQSQFTGVVVAIDRPYIVRDRLIHGELFTLIPIESSWCRGYMTLQTEEEALKHLVRAGKTHLPAETADDFRTLNFVLGELTNLVWGGFRNRYSHGQQGGSHLSQVPIVVNHLHRYISFGSSSPQLCIRCVLTDAEDESLPPVVIHQRFVFNLSWSPEKFNENECNVNSLVATGDLELF